MRIEIALKNLQGRHLVTGSRHSRFFEDFVSDFPEWTKHWDLSQLDLIAQPRELAAHAAQEFFAQMGLAVSSEVLIHLQKTIGH